MYKLKAAYLFYGARSVEITAAALANFPAEVEGAEDIDLNEIFNGLQRVTLGALVERNRVSLKIKLSPAMSIGLVEYPAQLVVVGDGVNVTYEATE